MLKVILPWRRCGDVINCHVRRGCGGQPGIHIFLDTHTQMYQHISSGLQDALGAVKERTRKELQESIDTILRRLGYYLC